MCAEIGRYLLNGLFLLAPYLCWTVIYCLYHWSYTLSPCVWLSLCNGHINKNYCFWISSAYYQVLQVPTPGFLQYTSIYVLKSVSFILIFNSLLLLNNPPFSSTISYAIFLIWFPHFHFIIYKITKIFKFCYLITFNSFLAILFIFTHLLLKSFAFCLCVWIYCKSVVDILLITLPSQPLNFHITRHNHATLLPSFIMQLLFSAPIFHFPVDNWRPLFIQFYYISLPLYTSESNFNNLVYCLYITILCSLPDIPQMSFV